MKKKHTTTGANLKAEREKTDRENMPKTKLREK